LKLDEALTRLHQLQSQAKLWAAQTKITAQTEIRILQLKLNSCIEQAEKNVSEYEEQLQTRLHEQQQMSAQLCTLDSAQKEYCVKIDELNSVICSAQQQIQNLSNTIKVG
jgi:hypothetical protein